MNTPGFEQTLKIEIITAPPKEAVNDPFAKRLLDASVGSPLAMAYAVDKETWGRDNSRIGCVILTDQNESRLPGVIDHCNTVNAGLLTTIGGRALSQLVRLRTGAIIAPKGLIIPGQTDEEEAQSILRLAKLAAEKREGVECIDDVNFDALPNINFYPRIAPQPEVYYRGGNKSFLLRQS